MRTAVYTRVSHERQVEEGFSLDAQLHRLRSYCDSQGWTIAGIYTDEGISAKDTDRPELKRMLADIEIGKIDVVLVYKLDRLTRSVLDLHQLLKVFDKYNVRFKSATEEFSTLTAQGRFFITLVAAMAAWERETLSERVRFAMVEMTKQGKWSGGRAAFGYDYTEGELVINEPQAEVVRGIFERYLAGNGSRKILQWLNDPEQPQLAPVKRWTLNALNYLLQNPLYAGQVRFGYRTPSDNKTGKAITQPGTHPAVISLSDFERAQQIRAGRSRSAPREGTGSYSLSGLLRCGICGSAMVGYVNYRRNKAVSSPRRYYVCGERAHSGLCDLPYMHEPKVEAALLDELERHFRDLSSRSDISVPEDDETAAKIHAHETELAKIRARRATWMSAFNEGTITPAELREGLDLVTEQESQIQRQLRQLEVRRPVVNQEFIASALATFRSAWEATDNPQMHREMIRPIIDHVVVNPDLTLDVHFQE